VEPRLQIAGLVYHEVTADPSESGIQRPSAMPYKHTPRSFLKNLDAIATSPLAPCLVNDIDFDQPGRYLLLTFDDGGKSARGIGDELIKRGWKGHFLVTTGLIGRRTFLDANGIRYLKSCGHSVGSHSHTHPDIFTHQPFEAMLQEWRMSCDILAQLLGEPCTVASVPGGHISRAVMESAAAAGIQHLFTSEPWLVPRKVGNCRVLGRVCIKNNTPFSHVEQYARLRGWPLALLKRRLKEATKTMLFPLYRAYIERRRAFDQCDQGPDIGRNGCGH